ncbi:hypothetical protein ACFYO1_35400 [Nocardia sp. NPDC006044]|uniref:hypothetical protein n=1 Tax=Nocardia sp. NPDC006044 TaxID=3364306 RepID=UPI003698B677
MAGAGVLIPAQGIASAELPTAPKVCTEQQEKDADAAAATECARLRTRSAEARRSSVPVPENPEKITPFEMKSDIGVEPAEQKSLFGEATDNENAGTVGAYRDTAARAAYFTGFYTARQGGELYFLPSSVESADAKGLTDYLLKKAGGNDGKTHDDRDLTPELLTAKKTALTALARADILTGKFPDLPDTGDIEADDAAAAEFEDATPGDTVANRIAADRAEAAAVKAAQAAGWIKAD